MSDYLHEDTVFQILKWLPAESLWRFRSVCKSWKARIDSQSFTLDYLSSQNPQFIVDLGDTHFCLAFDPDKLPTQDLIIRPIGNISNLKFHLGNTLHGIACLYDEVVALFVLWNPCIFKFSIVPPPVPKKSSNWNHWDDDDEDDDYIVGTHGGFWIDPCTREFKAVIFKLPISDRHEEDHCPPGGLYSSARKEWKGEISLDEILGFYNPEVTPPLVLGQVAYWTAFYEFFSDSDDDDDDDDDPDLDSDTEEEQVPFRIAVVVVLFDFGHEKFGRMDALSVKSDWHLPVLCNWEGCGPSLVYMTPDKCCHIYLRVEDSWVDMIYLPLKYDVCRVLCGMVQPEGKCWYARILATNESKELVLYDMKKMAFHVVRSGVEEWTSYATTFGFVDSLVFPFPAA